MRQFRKGFFGALFFIALITLILSLAYLGKYEYQTHKYESDFKSLKVEDGVDLKALRDKNNDLVGWIHVADTRIDYPVMWTPDDPEHYLRLNFEGEYSMAGTPFLDAHSDLNKSRHYLIYGHHMNSGTMFYDLDKYTDKKFLDEHPIVEFDTVAKEGNYRVFAVCYTDVYADGFRYYQYPFMAADDKKTFEMYVNNVKKMSMHDTGITPKYGDTILTLSTCNHERGDGLYRQNGRLIVVAVKDDSYHRTDNNAHRCARRSKCMQIDIAEEMYKKLEIIKEITGTEIDSIVEHALRGVVGNFSDIHGAFHPEKGTYLRRTAGREGDVSLKEEPCWILGHSIILGTEYTKLYYNGSLMSVPSKELRRGSK